MNRQETTWQGEFGNAYHDRNHPMAENSRVFFRKVLAKATNIGSVLELGAGDGINLSTINELYPHCWTAGVEINAKAHAQLLQRADCAILGSVFEVDIEEQFDLVLTKGWLIHVPPEQIKEAYRIIYEHSKKYILLCEYFSPVPCLVNYRGEVGLLWKRDFAGDMLDAYPDLILVDYGFWYNRDEHPQDNLNWWLLSR
jgi:spore coat polysaccharide biosynthesis protein SpsF